MLETNILKGKDGMAIMSFINEQAEHVSGLSYKLDLTSKNIDISQSSISEKEIVVVVGEQSIIPETVNLVSNDAGEQSLLITLPGDTVFKEKEGVHALPLDFEQANGQWENSETTRQLFEADLIQGFEYSEQATKEEGVRIKDLSVNSGRPLHYKLEVDKLNEKGEVIETITVIVDKENGVEAHYVGNNPPKGLQYVYVKGVETGKAITRKHLEQQTTEDEAANNNDLTDEQNNAEIVWQDMTRDKKEYFETFFF